MKNLTSVYSLAIVCFASLLLWSCGRADGEFTGSEYMPDMAHSIAYEANHNTYYYNNTWGTEEDYRNYARPRKSVDSTIARGFLPFKYQNLEGQRTSPNESYVELQEKVRKMILADSTIVNPIRPKSQKEWERMLVQGGDLYWTTCSVCHGDNADGNGILFNDGAGKYTAKPANFMSDEFLAASDGRFINAIMHGKGMMQPHADKLIPEERWIVIHYIRSLQAASKGEEYNPVVGAAKVNEAPANEGQPEDAMPDGGDGH